MVLQATILHCKAILDLEQSGWVVDATLGMNHAPGAGSIDLGMRVAWVRVKIDGRHGNVVMDVV